MTKPKARQKPDRSPFTARIRRRRFVRTLVAMAVLGLGGAAVWLVVFSSVLTVDDVRVSGADGELADIVRDTAQVPMGEKLIRVDTAEIAERVRGIGELDDASVSRSWPSAVTIRVSPREPLAVVADDESWWRIDAEGVLFGATSERPDDLPAIDVTVEPDRDAERAEGVAVATTLPGAVAEIVELVTVESRADVRLELAGGPMVLWGTAERTADKAAVLLALIDEYAANDDDSPPKVYDVSAPDRPAVTP